MNHEHEWVKFKHNKVKEGLIVCKQCLISKKAFEFFEKIEQKEKRK